MGNNKIPFSIAVGKNPYFLLIITTLSKRKNRRRNLINFTDDSVDPYDYHVLKCSQNMFSKMRRKKFFLSLKMMMKRCLSKMKTDLWVKMNWNIIIELLK